MWFGDYPDFPARVVETGEPLGDRLEEGQDTTAWSECRKELGWTASFPPQSTYSYNASFILIVVVAHACSQILSIAKALPLQIHPNKLLSEKLHDKQPEKFTDSNHKPEIAIALSRFEVFAGWKPTSDISPLFTSPVLAQFVPSDTTEWSNDTLRSVVQSILKADEKTIKTVEGQLATLSKNEFQDPSGQGHIIDLSPAAGSVRLWGPRHACRPPVHEFSTS